MTVATMTCQELVGLVTEYLEGTLSSADSARFVRHLALCPGCFDYVEQVRQTIRVAGSLTEEQIPPAMKEILLDVFRDWKRG